MAESDLQNLNRRLQLLEDEKAIARLISSYGPAADAGLTNVAAALWLDDGIYDWDARTAALSGSHAVDTMLQAQTHQTFIRSGAAHFAGPPLIRVSGDEAVALNYFLVILREDSGYIMYRVTANSWELVRVEDGWRVHRRTNRLLDESGEGQGLLADGVRRILGMD